MADKNDGEWFVWLFFGGLLVWLAYDKWWKEDKLARPPAPLYSPRPTGELYVTTNSGGTRLSLAAETVRGERSARQGWIVSDHANDKSVPQRQSKELWVVNCETTAFRTPSYVSYDKDDKVLHSINETKEQSENVRFPAPDTIASAVVDALCTSRFDPPN